MGRYLTFCTTCLTVIRTAQGTVKYVFIVGIVDVVSSFPWNVAVHIELLLERERVRETARGKT